MKGRSVDRSAVAEMDRMFGSISAEVRATMEKLGEAMAGLEYFELSDPQLHSP